MFFNQRAVLPSGAGLSASRIKEEEEDEDEEESESESEQSRSDIKYHIPSLSELPERQDGPGAEEDETDVGHSMMTPLPPQLLVPHGEADDQKPHCRGHDMRAATQHPLLYQRVLHTRPVDTTIQK